MKGFVFDPSRLRRPPWQLERDGYAFAAELLRERVGRDPLAEFRRRAQRDPVLREMLRAAADDLALAVMAMEDHSNKTDTP